MNILQRLPFNSQSHYERLLRMWLKFISVPTLCAFFVEECLKELIMDEIATLLCAYF